MHNCRNKNMLEVFEAITDKANDDRKEFKNNPEGIDNYALYFAFYSVGISLNSEELEFLSNLISAYFADEKNWELDNSRYYHNFEKKILEYGKF